MCVGIGSFAVGGRALLHAAGASSQRAKQLTGGYSLARLVGLIDNKAGLLECWLDRATVSHRHRGRNTHFMAATSDYHIAWGYPE